MPSDRSRVSSKSPARLEVRLLGAVEVILDGRRLGAFNSLRLQRFLALITLRRHLQHRPRLAFELWPDSSERQALTNQLAQSGAQHRPHRGRVAPAGPDRGIDRPRSGEPEAFAAPRNDGFNIMPVDQLVYRRGPKPAPFEFKGTSGWTITIDMNSKDVIAPAKRR